MALFFLIPPTNNPARHTPNQEHHQKHFNECNEKDDEVVGD